MLLPKCPTEDTKCCPLAPSPFSHQTRHSAPWTCWCHQSLHLCSCTRAHTEHKRPSAPPSCSSVQLLAYRHAEQPVPCSPCHSRSHCLSSMDLPALDPRAALKWGDQGFFRNEARTRQALPVQNTTQAPIGLTGQAQHTRDAQKSMLHSSKHPYTHPHVATFALSQPSQGPATFALISLASNGTAATGSFPSSFPSPAPRDRSPAEHPQHLLPTAVQPACEQPMSHPGCWLSSVLLWPGHSCKAIVTLC